MTEPEPLLPSLEQLQHRINAMDTTQKGKEGSAVESAASKANTAQIAKMAWNVVSGAAAGIFVGYALDSWLHSSPICLIAGFFIGFAGGVYALVRKVG